MNNAGPFNDAAFCDLREADWDYVMNANLKAVYLTAQLVAPDMQAAGWGRIVNIGATSGLVRSHGVYGLAKAALLHLTQSLALELAPAVTVNAIVPSQIASARTDGMPAYKAAAVAGTPLGRLVTQEEIARMVTAALLARVRLRHRTGHRDGRRAHDPPVPQAQPHTGVTHGLTYPRGNWWALFQHHVCRFHRAVILDRYVFAERGSTRIARIEVEGATVMDRVKHVAWDIGASIR